MRVGNGFGAVLRLALKEPLRYSAHPGADARVDFVTALGDDPFSEEMLAGWQAEGLHTRLVARLPGRLPGLYIIRTDAGGERSFHYWRSAAAAREMLRDGRADALADALAGFDLVYLSAITLGILDPDSRERLFTLLEALRRGGCRVAFDSNYRPRLWPDRAVAQEAATRAYALAAFALPTFEDEAARQAHLNGRIPAALASVGILAGEISVDALDVADEGVDAERGGLEAERVGEPQHLRRRDHHARGVAAEVGAGEHDVRARRIGRQCQHGRKPRSRRRPLVHRLRRASQWRQGVSRRAPCSGRPR